MLPIAEEYESSLTEVKSMENDLLATGYIHRITSDYIELVNPDEQMYLIPYDTRVKLSIFNSKLGFQILAGKVYLSTAKLLRIVEISSLGGYEKRTYFRLNVNMPAMMCPFSEQAEEGDSEAQPEPISITVENISLGGLSFRSDKYLQVGDKVIVDLELPTGPMSFHCEIRRANMRSDAPHSYGCRFFDCDDKQIDVLYKFIFQKQIAMLRKRKNYNP